MATSNYQKIKMLKLLEMLRTDADESQPLTTDEICRRLEEMEISCDRRTVTKDIELLNQYGYEVLSRMVGHKKGYFLADRSFSLSELKILIDAVQAASFVSEKKSEELIGKIAGLGSSYRADLLKNSLVRFNTSKHTNEQVYYAVLNIETALLERKKVSFFYYDLDENGERVYRKNKRRYIVDPVSLVMHEDNYYLLAYSEKYHGKTTYRIDRMETVDIDVADICAEAQEMQSSVDEHVKQAFRMYGGRTAKVTLQFDRSLIGCIYDKFGEETKIVAMGNDCFGTTVNIQVAPTFFGWVFQFLGKMEIVMPKRVVAQYGKYLKMSCDNYLDRELN